ncbi:hypothetical protein [Mesorhizobium sp.]|uniref:hypothetical protein n=1 Tax=Mesorhizobium sp. TaxID=1871066 RepID=UPI000FE962EF|nr:hypothetical protein [Mesorhizobium sp.]RWM10447.1 MAG: hypothetical protein EOR71_06725 [Mesorhizobium sp.]
MKGFGVFGFGKNSTTVMIEPISLPGLLMAAGTQASLVAMIVSMVFAGPAYAGGTLAEKMRENPTCQQFNDGCSICKISQGVASCSSPGIACIEAEWHCTSDPSKTGQ